MRINYKYIPGMVEFDSDDEYVRLNNKVYTVKELEELLLKFGNE